MLNTKRGCRHSYLRRTLEPKGGVANTGIYRLATPPFGTYSNSLINRDKYRDYSKNIGKSSLISLQNIGK